MGWGWLEGSQSQGGRCWGHGEMVGAEQEGGGAGFSHRWAGRGATEGAT